MLVLWKGEVIAEGSGKEVRALLEDVLKLKGLTLVEELDRFLNLVYESGKFEYGVTKASKLAYSFRKTSGKGTDHWGNIAIFEYLDDAGNRVRKEFTTFETLEEYKVLGYTDKVHSEKMGFHWIVKEGVEFNKVISIYSELEPCSFRGHMCKSLLEKNFPNARIEYSYKYPGKHSDNLNWIRFSSLQERQRDLQKLKKDL